MRFSWRARALDDFVDALRPELRATRTPRPSAALKARILASRAAGVRIILPDVAQPAGPSPRAAIAMSIAVALVVTLMAFDLRRAKHRAADSVASPGFFGQAAWAQTVRESELPGAPPARATSAARLRDLSLVFSRRLRDGTGRLLDGGGITLAMRAATVDGTRAWRLESVDHDLTKDQAQLHTETTYVAAADLGLLRRDIHVEPYRRFRRIDVLQRFDPGGVKGRMTTDGPSIGEGRMFRRRLSPAFAPYLTENVALVYLMAVPLDRGWRGSASLLGWAVRDDDVFLPIELRVEGEEVVSTPAGRFDCWRLSLRFAGPRTEYWARKSDGLGVRVLTPRDPRTGGTREIVLMEER